MIQSKSLVTFVMLVIAASFTGRAVADEQAPSRQDRVDADRFARPRAPAMPPTTPYSGWLGVQLAPVPAAVASQLKLGEQTGVMVRNIFKDSPADKAGLQRYDVIFSVDGNPVERGVEAFSQNVQSKKAGDPLKLGVYRGGEQSLIVIRLAEAPARLDERELKYEDDPDVASRRMFGLRGKILRQGPHGWILDDLGEIPNLPDFQGWFEGTPDEHEPGAAGGEDLQEGRRVDAKGNVLQVRRNPDGTVEVSRYQTGTPADKVEPKTYKDMDQLRKADPDAAEILAPATRPSGEEHGPWKQYREGMKKYQDSMQQRQEDMKKYQDSMRSYQDALRDYMKRYGERPWTPPSPPAAPSAPRWREWQQRIVPWQGAPVPPAAPGAPGREEPAQQPEAKFDVHPDGSIAVSVDKGPNQLNMTFPNEQEFKQKAPKLYERYRDTVESLR